MYIFNYYLNSILCILCEFSTLSSIISPDFKLSDIKHCTKLVFTIKLFHHFIFHSTFLMSFDQLFRVLHHDSAIIIQV